MYVCMYNVYMSFPQMRHCNIAPFYVCMYVYIDVSLFVHCMNACMYVRMSTITSTHSLHTVYMYVCMYVYVLTMG